MSNITTEHTTDHRDVRHQLTSADRCDSCGAQAYIRVSIGDSELLFCAHHGKKHQAKLAVVATDWHDESSRLIEASDN